MSNMDHRTEIENLKEELRLLTLVFDKKINEIQQKIVSIEKNLPPGDVKVSADAAISWKDRAAAGAAIIAGAGSTIKDLINARLEIPESEFSIKDTAAPIPPAEKLKKAADSSPKPVPDDNSRPIRDFLSDLAAVPVFGAFASLIGKMTGIYREYKEQGRLPVLFLTSAGILAVVAGAGYILQYSFMNYFGPVARVASAFAAASAIIVLGIRLIGKDDAYREYGSSLIGLGIIINYLCVYFASTFFSLIGPVPGFILVLINTAAAYVLAVKYETKVVSLISFLGGSFVPFFLGMGGQLTIFYLFFLIVLCVSALHLAAVIRWPAMIYISFAAASGIIQYSIFTAESGSDVIQFSVLFHLFSYLYIYHSLFDRLALRTSLNRDNIIVLSGAAALLAVNIYKIFDGGSAGGWFYLANTVPFALAALISSTARRSQTGAALLVFSGIFAALAVPFLFNFAVYSLLWLPEACALLILGSIYRQPVVRKEGYLLTAAALAHSLINVPIIFDNWDSGLMNAGTLNLLTAGALLFMVYFVLKRETETLPPFEKWIQYMTDEALSLWALFVWFTAAAWLIPDFAPATALIPAAILFSRAREKDLTVTRLLGFMCYGALFIQALYSFTILAETIIDSRGLTLSDLPGHPALLHIIVWGAVTWAAYRMPPLLSFSRETGEGRLSILFNEIFSFWALTAFLCAAWLIWPEFTLGLAVVPLAWMFYRSYRHNLTFTLMLAFFCYLLILTQAAVSAVQTGSLHFSDQTIYGKAAMAEAFILLWIMQLFHEKFMPDSSLIPFFRKTRLFFYITLPLIYLPHLFKKHNQFFPLGLWGSFLFTWLLHELLKLNELITEMKILLTAAAVTSAGYLLFSSEPSLASPDGAALLAGIPILAVFLTVKNGMDSDSMKSNYAFIFSGTVLYWVFSVSAVVFALTGSHGSAVFAGGAAAVITARFSSRIPPAAGLKDLYLRGGQSLILLGSLHLLGASAEGRDYNFIPEGIFQAAALLSLGLITFRSQKDKNMGGITEAESAPDLIFNNYVFNAVLAAMYLTLLFSLTGDWTGPFTTVAIVAHSVFVMFYATVNNFKKLVPLYVAGFALSSLKIFLYDLKGFTMIEKVIAFTVIGALLLTAAYGLQRIAAGRKKQG
jgi:hypothetical protein